MSGIGPQTTDGGTMLTLYTDRNGNMGLDRGEGHVHHQCLPK